MAVKTLLFRIFHPDKSIFDDSASHVANNVLPVAGTYRPLPQLQQAGTLNVAGSNPVDGPILTAFSHVYTPSAPIQKVRPDERTGSTSWLLHTRGTADANDDLTQQEQEASLVGTEFYDDGGYLVSPGAATNELAEFTVEVVQAPPGSAHFLFLRYKIFDPDDTNAWTVVLRVKGNAGTIASVTATGTGEQDWATVIHPLTGGEMGNFVAGDYTTEDQMTLELDGTIAGSNQTVDPDEDVLIGGWLDESAEDEDLYTKLTDASDATYVDSPVLVGAPEPIVFGMADAETPASFSNLAVILKWNSRNSGIKTNLELYAAGVLVAKAEDITPPTSATSETKTLTVEDDVNFPDVAWDDLRVAILPRYPVEQATAVFAKYLPAADVGSSDWVTSPLFSKINDESDGTVITSPTMAANVDESFTVDLDATPNIAAVDNREKQVVVRARNDDGSNAHSFKVDIIQNSVSVASKTFSLSAGAALADKTWELDNLRDPASDVSSSGWSTAPLFSKIDDDTNLITSGGSAGDNFIVGFADPVDPSVTEGWLLRLTGYVDSGGTEANLDILLYDGTTLRQTISSAVTLGTDEDVYIVPFSAEQIGNFDDYTDVRVKVNVVETGPVVKIRRLLLEAPDPYPEVDDFTTMRVKVTAVGDSTAGWTIGVADVKLELKAAPRIVVYELDLQTDPTSYVAASWAQMQVPEASSGSLAVQGDAEAVIAGRMNRIYLVDSQDSGGTVFTDISKGTADMAGDRYPWDYCSWGQQVLLTNKDHAVQKYNPDTDTETSDLITSTDKPKGRFMDVVRNQVVLANIDFSGSPAGNSDEVWGSADEDAADFDDAGTSGQFRQRLRQTPGEITAFLGGEYMLCWKRRSLIRGTYINSPLWYRFDVISRSVGTTQPDSIVRWRRLVFFYGSDGRFYQTDGAQEPEPIDDGLHYSMAPDGDFEIRRVSANYPPRLQNRIFGAYDPGTKCIVWVARGGADLPFENRRLFIYNTIEKRFSTGIVNFGSGYAYGLSALLERANVENDSHYLMSGLTAFGYDADNSTAEIAKAHFSGPAEAVTIDTPVYPLDTEDAEGYVNRARVLFRADRKGRLKKLPGGLPYTVTLTTWDSRPELTNERTETLSSVDADPDAGWMRSSLKGRFVQARLTIARSSLPFLALTRTLFLPRDRSQPHPPIKELIGIQIDPEKGER